MVIDEADINRAPGPDGFTAKFFKLLSTQLKDDIMEAVTNFF